MTTPWYTSRYTGLLRAAGTVPRAAHDPDVVIWAGELPGWGTHGEPLAAGGAGWDTASAEAAAVGEAIERWQSRSLPQDLVHEASYQHWSLDEPAVPPEKWILYHADQYARPGFPFIPFSAVTRCHWVCCREARTGDPSWAPADLVFLDPHQGGADRLAPSLSTGLSCGRDGQPILLRGLQEVIERDALVGAWWRRYPLVEHDPAAVFASLDPALAARLQRPNLRYRFYRAVSPFSTHVTLATIAGEDRGGFCFSVGSACRETRAKSWEKSLLEALQGRPYVRYLKSQHATVEPNFASPADFADHAVYYSLHPDELGRTVLQQPATSSDAGKESESLEHLLERLGPQRPVLFRILTPPPLIEAGLDWIVLRVLVPGLQPLHGHHDYAFLGGPLWSPRSLADWRDVPPHPFA